MKQVLLGSGGNRTPERIALHRDELRRHFGDIERLLFIPYALREHEQVIQTMLDRGLDAGYELDGLHRHADLSRAVVEASGFFVTGGNTFRLLYSLAYFGLLDLIRDRVLAGVPYFGVSAGANIACPTIKTTNDMPIVQPPSFDALRLTNFQLNPHYYSGSNYVRVGVAYEPHFGETRDERLEQFLEENETPVIGLPEGGFLRVTDDACVLIGTPARLFRRGQPPLDVRPPIDLAPLLK